MNKQDLLKHAVVGQRAVSPRAEDLRFEDHKSIFVDNPQQHIMSNMNNTANQILFGRRGTGKTMLLKQLLFGGKPTTPESDYIAIMLQSYDFIQSPDIAQRDSAVIRSRSYFREFLRQVSDQMLQIADKVLRDDGLMARLGLTNRIERKLLEDRFLRLSHILQYGVPVPQLNSSTHIKNICSENLDEHSKKHQAGISLNAKLEGGYVTAPLRVGSSAHGDISSMGNSSYIDSQKASSHSNYNAVCDMGIPEIRNLLRDIIKMLKVNQVMILLDEWQALNDCQSEFAEQLKSCLFGLDCVSIKIAAYRNICTFNNGATRANFRGLEINQDIFDVGDVDLPPATKDTQMFFFKMLYRRLVYKVPELQTFYGSIDRFDYNQLVIDIFKNQRAAEMLARGSHGVSRDFIEVFNYASNLVANDVARDKITLDHVEKAHGALSRNIRRNIQTADDIGGFLFEIIKPQVHRTKVPYFFINRCQSDWNELILELVEKRALHIIHQTDMPDGAEVDWIGYEVSYGLFEDWQRALLFSNKPGCNGFDWTDIKDKTFNSENFDFYVLRLDESPRALRLCTKCKKEFSTASRSYIMARRCPHCFEEQTEIEES